MQTRTAFTQMQFLVSTAGKEAMTAKNNLAEQLLARLLALNIRSQAGFYGTHHYCIGVPIHGHADAYRLGATLGDEFGSVKLDQWGSTTQQFIVFVDTRVSS